MEDTRVTFLIDKELRDRLKIQAVKENRSMTEIIIELIEGYLDDRELAKWKKSYLKIK